MPFGPQFGMFNLAPTRPTAKDLDDLIGCPEPIGQEEKVDQCGSLAVSFGNFGGADCVPYVCCFESMLEQVAKMGFYAHVGKHTGKDHLTDALLAKLQDEIVRLRIVYFVWRTDNRPAVLNLGLILLQEVRAGVTEPFRRVGALSIEGTNFV